MKKDKIRNDSVFMLQEESYEDSVIPFLKKELNRDVKIVDKVEVLGGIYCRNLELKSNEVFIQNSVYARDSISLASNNSKQPNRGSVWFGSMVASGNSIFIEPKSNELVRFGNSISSTIVNLSNCVVYGNVFCDQLILKNSIVLGTVYCKNELIIHRSIIGSYQTREIKQNGRFGLLHNFGFSEEQPDLTDKVFALSLVGVRGGNTQCIFEIGNEEIYPINDEKTQMSGFVMSPSLRFFDLSDMTDVLEDNVNFIIKIANITPEESRAQVKVYQQVEEVLMAILRQNFEMESKIPSSRFYDIQDEVLDAFMNDSEAGKEKSAEDKDAVHSKDSKPEYKAKNDETKGSERNSLRADNEEVETSDKFTNEIKEPLSRTEIKATDPPGNPAQNQAEATSEVNQKPSLLTCPNCEFELSDTDMKFCTNCGQALPKQ